ncbi:PEPxxWA-CTERM sorting domain-containing protein [Sphingomonas sp. KRR8]|uniref:PEPxxWA-CTERM sorting domain-containing protein n=1 Tax=Sphingomonas sp. KRR8 TaxID=2942996 RepID=UPI00202185CE|nr:PEPxxWA-CTERM sorting domain-containing protein [Sphingomonas sp. KRR8]URD62060.1 PEPxxWA-CTERM sorting domain-containing protein [Sphingomonas sp. KRR8]
MTISTTSQLSDVRQIRLGGIQAAAAVPERATWALMLMGLGAVGFSMRRRRVTARPTAQMA